MTTHGSSWSGGRAPLSDPQAETARVEAYWQWLSEHGAAAADAAHVAVPGLHWVRLRSEQDADWEASRMQHSIGHSWAKYSAIGELHSLRDSDRPVATILVRENSVIHAREERNARLSLYASIQLTSYAETNGWSVKPDPYQFDVMTDDVGHNTRLRYLRRADGIHWSEAVISGRFDEGMVHHLSEQLNEFAYFDAKALGLPSAAGGFGDHELSSLKHVSDDPTSTLDIRGFMDGIDEQARQMAGCDFRF